MKTVLFDIGNVLLAFDFRPALKSITGSNAAPDAFEKIIAQKDVFEAGKQEKSDFITWASSLLDFSGSNTEFEQAWTSIFTPILPMWDLAKKLHEEGHRLILFSNTNSIHAPFCLRSYENFSYFDGAVFSHEIGAIKPDVAFYEHAMEKYELVPESTYYIDDLKENIEAGHEFGFTCFLYDYREHAAFLNEFENKFRPYVPQGSILQ